MQVSSIAYVEAHGSSSEAPVDHEIAVGLLAQRDIVRRDRACEQLLRERRAVVGQVRLVADDHQRAIEAEASDLLGGAQPGERRTDDDDGSRGHDPATLPVPSFVARPNPNHGAIARER